MAIDEDYEFKDLFESAQVRNDLFKCKTYSPLFLFQVVLPGAGVTPKIHAVLASVLTPDSFRGWNKPNQTDKVLASG